MADSKNDLEYPDWFPERMRKPWVVGGILIAFTLLIGYMAFVEPKARVKTASSPLPSVTSTASSSVTTEEPEPEPEPSSTDAPSSGSTSGSGSSSGSNGSRSEASTGLGTGTNSPGKVEPSPQGTIPGEGKDSTEGFISTSSRPPQSEDSQKGKEVLSAVIPLWASNSFEDGTSASSWVESFAASEGSSDTFVSMSREQFAALWGGANALGYAVKAAKVTSTEYLWNVGSHSLWRVTVERDLVPLARDGVDESTEEVTWDFLVRQEGDAQDTQVSLVAFLDPAKEHERPETFRLSPEYR